MKHLPFLIIILIIPFVFSIQLIRVDQLGEEFPRHVMNLSLVELLEDRFYPNRTIDEVAIKLINAGDAIVDDFAFSIRITLYDQEEFIEFHYDVASLGELDENEYFIVDLYTNLTLAEEGEHPVTISLFYEHASSTINATLFLRDNWAKLNITNISFSHLFPSLEDINFSSVSEGLTELSFHSDFLLREPMQIRRLVVETIPYERVFMEDIEENETTILLNGTVLQNSTGLRIHLYCFDEDGYFHADRKEISFT
ncbi:MAG: hypothetical protein H6502_00405 [Candidatus Woesearchaeota archaeon]|nr:MAG: hypothetical protein H6502_00405 [Candidatus Woesearchaeota archaeon]